MADIYSILAGKGRGQDKYIRNVDGEPSHVNEIEKDAIDIYGLLGEIFTKNIGTGDTNPNTGLPEYDTKKEYGVVVPDWLSPHNKKHNDGTYKNVRGNSHSTKTEDELRIEDEERRTQGAGADLLNSDQTVGDMSERGALGQTVLSAEDYKGMTPDAIVNDIFQKQYNNIVPPDMDMTEVEFKQQLAAQLGNMPQFQEADEKGVGFLDEAKDLAGRSAESSWDATKYGLQGQAGNIGSMLQSGFGGGGAGMRGAIGGQQKISQGFGAGLESRDIALDTADLGHRKGVYGLEQAAGAEWESGFQSFLNTLPSAV